MAEYLVRMSDQELRLCGKKSKTKKCFTPGKVVEVDINHHQDPVADKVYMLRNRVGETFYELPDSERFAAEELSDRIAEWFYRLSEQIKERTLRQWHYSRLMNDTHPVQKLVAKIPSKR